MILGGVLPCLLGATAGILVGVSAPAYWVIALLAGVGGFFAGFEHENGWGGADRGLVGGFLYGASLLIAHEIAGTDEKVSLGDAPILLPVVTAIIGMLLGALAGRIAKGMREREETQPSQTPPAPS